MLNFYFTRARDQLPYDKLAAIKGLAKVFYTMPLLIFSRAALVSLVKIFIPKSVLRKRIDGF